MLSHFVDAQTPVYTPVIVKTPNRTTIEADSLISGDLTPAQKNDAKNFWLNCYNDRIIYMGEATYKYNCHAYAWHVSEGGSQVWIDTPNDDTYWEDFSYSEVLSQAAASKVSFGGPCYQTWTTCLETKYSNPCDHSAITTGTPDYFISKWGPSPLFRHHKNDCPYSTEDLHYYAAVTISGPSFVCNTNSTFTLHNLPAGATCSWAFSPGNRVTPSSGNDTVATFRTINCSIIEKGSLVYTVTAGDYSCQIIKSGIIMNGPPYQDVTLSVLTAYGQTIPAQSLLCPYTTYHMYIHNNSICSTSNYTWEVPSEWTLHYTYHNMASVNTNDSPWGNVIVKAQTCCTGCGYDMMIHSAYFSEDYECGQEAFTIYPNPAGGYVNIDINKEKADVVSLNNVREFRLTVTDISGIVKYTGRLNELPYRLNTVTYRDGIYIINIAYDGKIWSSRFGIRH